MMTVLLTAGGGLVAIERKVAGGAAGGSVGRCYDGHGLRPSEGVGGRGWGTGDRKAASGQFCENYESHL